MLFNLKSQLLSSKGALHRKIGGVRLSVNTIVNFFPIEIAIIETKRLFYSFHETDNSETNSKLHHTKLPESSQTVGAFEFALFSLFFSFFLGSESLFFVS